MINWPPLFVFIAFLAHFNVVVFLQGKKQTDEAYFNAVDGWRAFFSSKFES